MRSILKDSELLIGKINGEQFYREDDTEAYVEIPPAFIITESNGAAWTLGTQFAQHGADFEFNVMRNDVDTGEMASKIVYQRGKVRIFGQGKWKVWTGKYFL